MKLSEERARQLRWLKSLKSWSNCKMISVKAQVGGQAEDQVGGP